MLLTVAVLLAACAKQPADTAPAAPASPEPATAQPAKPEGPVKIGFMVKQPEEAWFQNEWEFADKCAQQYGFELIKIGATDGEKVLTGIDNLAAAGAQGFIICTPDVKLGPAIVERANKHNLKVYAVDDQLVGPDGEFLDVPYMGISASDIGQQVGKALADEYQARGWTTADTAAAAITFESLNTARERTDGTIKALTEAGFPADLIFKSAERTTDVEGSLNAMNTLLTQHPEIKHWLVFSMNDEGVLGAVRALESHGIVADDIAAIGIGGSTAFAEMAKPTTTGFVGTVLISPKRHGYETTEAMYKWITEGVEPPKDTRTEGIYVTRANYQQVAREQGLMD
jgi:L-arabinose transport system substrate-binding protein